MNVKTVCGQIKGLAEISRDKLVLLPNISAVLNEALEDINWVGFYLVKDDSLLVGPFQGKPACVKIEKGKGVCGTAWLKDEVQLVDDVHQFPGHIACDSASNSEIVIPLHDRGKVVAVLDIDSPSFGRFQKDAADLIETALVIEELVEW